MLVKVADDSKSSASGPACTNVHNILSPVLVLSRLGVASVIWESLVSMRRCSREEFANNRSAHSFFIYIDICCKLHHCMEPITQYHCILQIPS